MEISIRWKIIQRVFNFQLVAFPLLLPNLSPLVTVIPENSQQQPAELSRQTPSHHYVLICYKAASIHPADRSISSLPLGLPKIFFEKQMFSVHFFCMLVGVVIDFETRNFHSLGVIWIINDGCSSIWKLMSPSWSWAPASPSIDLWSQLDRFICI